MKPQRHPVVERYLAHLDTAIAGLEPVDRAEVLQEIRNHIAEAMAVGTPVFAYDCGALAEVIGRGGVVVAEGERARLAEALNVYFAAPATEKGALGDAARKQAAQFSDEAIASRLVDLWSSFDRSS